MRVLQIMFLSLVIFPSYGQIKNIDTPKSIVVIGTVGSGKCEYKAIKLEGDFVTIDSCFDKPNNMFTIDRVQSVNDNSVFQQLQSLTSIKLRKIQESLDSIHTCDYARIFVIQLIDINNKYEAFSLKGFTNCYPASVRKLMESLANYFEIKR